MCIIVIQDLRYFTVYPRKPQTASACASSCNGKRAWLMTLSLRFIDGLAKHFIQVSVTLRMAISIRGASTDSRIRIQRTRVASIGSEAARLHGCAIFRCFELK